MRRCAAILSLILMLAAGAQACPACKDSVSLNGDQTAQTAGALGAGFNASIYLMLGSVFAVIGGLSCVFYRATRKQ